MIKVVVADDHAVVRTGLQLIFNEEDIDISGAASNGNELLNLLKEKQFDVAVVDINMPGNDSLHLILEVGKRHPKLPIVIFTMSKDEQLIFRMLQNGVKACINKEEDLKEIIQAVKNASKNEMYLTSWQKSLFAEKFISGIDSQQPHHRLTDREYQVMCLMAEGKTKDEIARKLDISKNTLSNHRNNILKKMHLSNIAELTKYALQNQLIS